MIKFRISQYGRQTIRYSLNESMKVMNDRKLTKGDKGLLRIYCDTIDEAEKILKNKLYNPKCTFIFANYESQQLYWFNSQWVSASDFFSDDIWIVEGFFEKQNERENIINVILNNEN